MALPASLRDFNVFIDGETYIGRCTELELPKLTRKMEDYLGAGTGPVKLDMGMEALECSVTLAEYSPELLKKFATPSADGVMLRFMGAYQADNPTATVDAVEIVMRGRFTELDFGSAKRQEATELKLACALTYYSYSQAGENLLEIDLLNKVENVGGVDRFEQIRAAIGI